MELLVIGGYNDSGYLSNVERYDPASKTFSTTGSMIEARYGYAATLLPSGKVLVTGGYNDSGYLNSAELYDPASGTFTATGSMATARYRLSATLLPNGKVLVSGGKNGSSYLNSTELYDPANGTFTPTGSMVAAREYPTATLLPNGKVLVSGGFNGSFLNSSELYDPANGTFTATGSMAAARYENTATLLPNGKVLVSGGYNNTSPLNNAELYDPANGTFTATGSMATARYGYSATLLPSGKVLVSGGNDGISYLDSSELYDPTSGTFAITGNLTIQRGRHSATLLPNVTVLISGGSGIGGYLNSAELYDTGLGFSDTRRPVIATATATNTALHLSGTGFKGDSEASGGGFNSSATNYPLLQLRRLDNAQSSFILPDSSTPWSANSFTSGSLYGLPIGHYQATLFANAIPSVSVMMLVAPAGSTSPASMDFPAATISTTTTPLSVTLSNSGSADLVIGTRTIAGTDATHFASAGGTCGSTLIPGSSCTVDVTFTPTTSGSKSATLNIPTNDPNTPVQSINLTGTAVNLTQPLTLTVSGSGTVHTATTPATTDMNCSGVCSQSFDSGTIVTLTAVPMNNYTFTGWSGACSSSGACQVTLDQSRSVTATFAIIAGTPLDIWANRTPGSIPQLAGVTYGKGIFVAVGGDSIYNICTILASADGTNWSSQPPGTNEALYAVTYGAGTFVAVGQNGTILTSADGTTWTSRTSGTVELLHGVTYGANTFIAVGRNGTILTSGDGTTWTSRISGTIDYLQDVTYGSDTFVVVGGSGAILTSNDGSTWTSRTSGITSHLFGITSGNGLLVTVGNGSTVLTSVDRITWTAHSNGTLYSTYGVTYADGTFVTVGNDGTILSSVDGIIWTSRFFTGNMAQRLWSVTYGNNTFVAVGGYTGIDGSGIILQSGSSATPKAVITPAAITFGTVDVYSMAVQSLTISNSGNADLVVSSIDVTGSGSGYFYPDQGTCPSLTPTLAPGTSCSIDIWFAPEMGGNVNAVLRVTANDPTTPFRESTLSGAGYDPPPVGSILVNGGATLTKLLNVNLALNAMDNSGVVAEMRFSNNGTAWNAWEAYATSRSWTLTAGDGLKRVYVQYRDGNGNISSTYFKSITFDTTPPTVTFSAKPADPSNLSNGSFTFSASESGVTYKCSLDSGSYVTCSTPYNFTGLAAGSHSLNVKGADPAGNEATIPTAYSWVIDTTEPDVTIGTKPVALVNTNTATFTFSSTDASATFECKIDFGTFTACVSPFTTPVLSEFIHSFQVRAKDTAGNVSTTPASYNWTIDTTPPDTSIVAVPTVPTTSTSFNSTHISSEPGGTFECLIDNGSYSVCGGTVTYNNLSVGTHTFTVRAKDAAGNYDPTPASYTWTINPLTPAMVKIGSNNYATLTAALQVATNGDKLKLLGSMTPETMVYTGNGVVTLEGGYDDSWNRQTNLFSPISSLTISSGTLIVDQIVVR